MVYELKFGNNAKIRSIWQHIVEDTIRNGGSLEALEKEVDNGYVSGTFPGALRRFNKKYVIEAPEVLEYAYSKTRYYRVLAKHGYPVPFAMDDFDDKTKTDEKWRKNISAKVDETKKKIFQEGRFKEDTDDYKRELGRRIFQFLRQIYKPNNDCPVQATDWEAMENNCGLCTEKSAIIYFAFNYAGLSPSFLVANTFPPKFDWISRYATTSTPGSLHSMVGVPLSNGRMIYADFTKNYFDETKPFAEVVTPRQFAIQYLENKIKNLEKKSGHRYRALSELQSELDPDDPRLLVVSIMQKIDKMNPSEFAAALKQVVERYGRSQQMNYYLATLQIVYAVHHGASPEDIERLHGNFMRTLEELSKVNPQLGSLEGFIVAEGLYHGLNERIQNAVSEREKEDIARSSDAIKMSIFLLLKRIVTLNPRFAVAIGLMDRLARDVLTVEKRIGVYEELLKLDPENGHIHNRLADLYVVYAEELLSEGLLTPKLRHDLFSLGLKHARYVADKSDPDQADARYMLIRYALITVDIERAYTEAKKAYALIKPNKMLENETLRVMLLSAVLNGDDKFVKDLIAVFQKRVENWVNYVANMLISEDIPVLYFGNVFLLDEKRSTKSITVLEKLVSEITDRLNDRSMSDRIWALYAAIMMICSRGDKTIADRFKRKIVSPDSLTLNSDMKKVLQKINDGLKGLIIGRDKLPKLLQTATYLEDLLGKDKKEAIPTYIVTARHAIEKGDMNLAKDALNRMLYINAKLGSENYFEDVCKPLNGAFVSSSRDKTKLRDMSLAFAALDLLWVEHKRIPQDIVKNLIQNYELAASEFQKVGDASKVKLARSRANALRRFLRSQSK
jgi:tetratricopeptide (TPR) repeat protein